MCLHLLVHGAHLEGAQYLEDNIARGAVSLKSVKDTLKDFPNQYFN